MVFFTHDIFSSQRAGGVSRCMIELMRELDQQDGDFRLFVGESANEMIDAEAGAAWYRRHVVGGRRPPRSTSLVRNELAVRQLLAVPDVVHRTYHPRMDLIPRSVAVVETLHDLWDQIYGDRLSPRLQLRHRLKRRALCRADVIICVSQFTQDQLATIWPDLHGKSVVIHHGVRRFPSTASAKRDRNPFFLYVGRRDLYKNFAIAVRALAGEPRLDDFHIVCFGGGAFTDTEVAMIRALGLSGRVWAAREATDDLLGSLYRRAAALLYPTRHEGFGLPLLEAMISDCPVITSPCASLPEIAGSAALYADPDDQDDWTENMQSIVFDTARRATFIEAGQQRVQRFSWAASAKAHTHVYARLKP